MMESVLALAGLAVPLASMFQAPVVILPRCVQGCYSIK